MVYRLPFLHHGILIWLFLHPVWTVSVDIFIRVQESTECVAEEVCIENNDSHLITQTVSWIKTPSDLFSAAKHVHSAQGHMILQVSTSECQVSYVYSEYLYSLYQNYSVSCTLNCSEYMRGDNQLFTNNVIFNVTGDTFSLFFDRRIRVNIHRETIVSVIDKILSFVKWNNYILFTSDYDVVIDSSSGGGTPFQLVYTLEDVVNLNGTLASIYTALEEEDLNFIVLCSTKCILKFLHEAALLERKKMKRSRWLLIPVGDALDVTLQTQLQVKTEEVIFLAFPKCSEQYPVFDKASVLHHLSQVQNMDHKTLRHLKDFCKKISARTVPDVSATVYLLRKSQNETALVSAGYIGRDEVKFTTDLYPGMKYGFNNKTLIIATLEWPPFTFKEKKNGQVTYTGICIDLMKELASRLNFSYRIIEPEDGEFGRNVNGTWTGLVGLLANKKADLVTAAITIDVEREKVMDFTDPYYFVHSAVLLKKPDSDANKWMTLVAPFRYEVHIGILLALIFSTVFLFTVEEINPFNKWTDNSLSARRTRYGDVLWYHFGALMANGGAYLPSTQSGRSVLSCWWFFTVICAAVYSGNLIAFLSDWKEKPPFSTLVEMVEQDTYHWGTVGGSVYINLFQDSNRSEYKKIWNGMVTDMVTDPDVLSTDTSVHLNKVLSSQYAYITDQSILELWQAQNCELYTMKEEFFLMSYGLGLTNNSMHTKDFSEQIARIRESGLVDLWYKLWMPKSNCESSKASKRVDLFALQSAFYASAVGVLLALVILIGESLCNRKYNEHTTKTTEK